MSAEIDATNGLKKNLEARYLDLLAAKEKHCFGSVITASEMEGTLRVSA